MSFTVIPFGSSTPVDAFSRSNSCSLVLTDSGSGGQVCLNGLGITGSVVAGAVNLKTFFGAAFRSFVLLSAFKAFAPGAGNQAAENQLAALLKISMYPVGSLGLAAIPAINYLGGLANGPNTVPYLAINGPAVAGQWRLDLQLRHSLTG